MLFLDEYNGHIEECLDCKEQNGTFKKKCVFLLSQTSLSPTVALNWPVYGKFFKDGLLFYLIIEMVSWHLLVSHGANTAVITGVRKQPANLLLTLLLKLMCTKVWTCNHEQTKYSSFLPYLNIWNITIYTVFVYVLQFVEVYIILMVSIFMLLFYSTMKSLPNIYNISEYRWCTLSKRQNKYF